MNNVKASFRFGKANKSFEAYKTMVIESCPKTTKFSSRPSSHLSE